MLAVCHRCLVQGPCIGALRGVSQVTEACLKDQTYWRSMLEPTTLPSLFVQRLCQQGWVAVP